MSLVWDVPFIAMNHLESLYAAFLEEPDPEIAVGRTPGERRARC